MYLSLEKEVHTCGEGSVGEYVLLGKLVALHVDFDTVVQNVDEGVQPLNGCIIRGVLDGSLAIDVSAMVGCLEPREGYCPLFWEKTHIGHTGISLVIARLLQGCSTYYFLF